MAHRMTYLRIHCNNYDRGWPSDEDRRNSVGLRFVSELIDQLLQQGRMVTAETDCGPGIRTATAKELRNRHQPMWSSSTVNSP